MLKKIIDYFVCLYKSRKCIHVYKIDTTTLNLITNKKDYTLKCQYCGDQIKIELNDKG
jgi:aspartate carbamoyltransferase regulatory subunit